MKLSGICKSYIALFLLLFSCTLVYVFYVDRQQDIPSLLKRYENAFSFQPWDFVYKKVEKALFDEALIFYGVQFPAVPISHRILKMTVSEKQGRLSVVFDGVSFNPMTAVKEIHADRIEQIMRSYIPFKSIAMYPIESLVLAGIDRFNARIQVTFEPQSDQKLRVYGNLSAYRIFDISFSMDVDYAFNLDPFYFVTARPVSVTFQVKDKGFMEKYTAYARQVGSGPQKTEEANQGTNDFSGKINVPVSFSDLFR